MSRRKLKSRAKITQRMSRNGLVERNAETGENTRISKRETELDLLGGNKASPRIQNKDFALKNEPSYSQLGNSLDNKAGKRRRRKRSYAKPAKDSKAPTVQGELIKPFAEVNANFIKPANTDFINKTGQSEQVYEPDSPVSDNTEPTAVSAETCEPPNDSGFVDMPPSHTDTRQISDIPPASRIKHDGNSRLKYQPNVELPLARPSMLQHDSVKNTSKTRGREPPKAVKPNKIRQEHPEHAPLQESPAELPPNITPSFLNEPQPNIPQSLPYEQSTEAIVIIASGSSQHDEAEIIETPSALPPKQASLTAYKRKLPENIRTAGIPSMLQHEPERAESSLNHGNRFMAQTDSEESSRQQTEETSRPLDGKQSEDTVNPAHIRHKKNPYQSQTLDAPVTPDNQTAQSKISPAQHNMPPPGVIFEDKPSRLITDTPDMPAPSQADKPVIFMPHIAPKTEQSAETEHSPSDIPIPVIPFTVPVEEPPAEAEQNSPAVPLPSIPHTAPESRIESAEVKPETPESSLKAGKEGKLKLADDETAPEKPKSRKLVKAERQAEQADTKLEKAKSKLPSTRKLRSERVFDENTGKAKRLLYFEKEVKSQSQHIKGSLPLRPVKFGANAVIVNAHRKIYQVENDNVSVKTAHRMELALEGGARSALRFHKTAPYRKAAKLEKDAAKKAVNLNYQKSLADNPKLKSNIFSRMAQKRKIKKDYAKAVRESKKAAGVVKQAGSATAKAARALTSVVTKHPIVLAVVLVIAVLIFIFMSLFGLGTGVGGSGLNAVLASSYLAGDADIENAELTYSEMENDLLFQISDAENSHPGYDEYRYNTSDISHNPYELMAYLTAVYYDFTYDEISDDLLALFNEQYTLDYDETTETRYADPDDTDEDGDYEPYEWKILTVSLTARPFSEVILSKMSAEQQEHYSILMQSKGSRQYAGNPFDIGWLPYVTDFCGWRIHPITGEKDLHRGIDIGIPESTEIHSGQDGTVTFAGYNGSYGNVVVIENDKGLVTKYAHCSVLHVSAGQTVSEGDVIAEVGSTGDSTGAHLHLEILKDGQYLNPLFFADSGNDGSIHVLPGHPGGIAIPEYSGEPMDGSTFDALIEEAEKYIGMPYRWGGSNPSTSFDCSGFVYYTLNESGAASVGRTTAQGLFNLIVPVAFEDAEPGDLLFFHSTYSSVNPVTHVAIYLGGGDFIHAGDPIGYGSMDSSYWQEHFYSAARIS